MRGARWESPSCRSASPSKWTRSSPSGADPLVTGSGGFAHRGLHGGPVPENSMAAFRAAIAADVGIECDLRLTSDHKIVVFHDSDAWRVCGYSLLIGDTACDEVQRLNVGGDPIPRLEELLALVDGQVPLLLEVKVDADVRYWVPALKKALANYRGKHGVMSFDPRISRLLKLAHPRVRRGLVIRDELAPVRRRVAMMVADPHFIAVERTAVAKPWVQAVRERLPVYSWTIRGPQQRVQAQVHADALIWESDGRP